MCSLIVPNVPQPEMMVTKGGEIIEKDTGERKQGRLFCGPDFTYLGVLGSSTWKMVYAGIWGILGQGCGLPRASTHLSPICGLSSSGLSWVQH